MGNELYTGSGFPVRLNETIGEGGEALVFDTSRSDLCAKIYSNNDTLVERIDRWKHRKLRLMVQNPPEDPAEQKDHSYFAWPEDVLYREPGGPRCIGFLMPLINSDKFRDLHTYKTPSSRRSKFKGFSWYNLFSVALNISVLVSSLHKKGYCVGDINEENILVDYKKTLATIIDCDSFQVYDPDTGDILPCPVGKPEYTAPELSDQAEQYKDIERTPESDAFALGILLFELLMENTSPYQGIGPALEDAPSAPAKLKKGLFPYLPKNRGANPPPSAPPFEILHPRLRDLFVRCFDEGHSRPNRRPSAEEWADVLGSLRDNFQQCQKNENHRFLNHLEECPWCNWSPPGVADCFPNPQKNRRKKRKGRRKTTSTGTGSAGASKTGASKRGGQKGNTGTTWSTVIITALAIGMIGVVLSEATSSGSGGTSSDSGSPNLTSTEEYVDRAVEDLGIVSTEEAVRTLKNMASDHPDRKVVDALEKARADLNQVGDDWAPLHKAARAETRADIELARLLLEAGFDPDIEGYFSNTPLHVAASAGNAEVVRLLIEAGADPNAKNDDGNIDFYGGPDAHDGQTPLHEAAEEGNEEIVRILLQAGANPNLTDSGGRTALEDAGNDQVKRILREGMRR